MVKSTVSAKQLEEEVEVDEEAAVEVDEERGVKLQKGAAGALAVEARRPDGLGASSAPARPVALQKIET
jgi:hypothetical protein